MTRLGALKSARRHLGLDPDKFRVHALRRHARCQIVVCARLGTAAAPRHTVVSRHTWADAIGELQRRYGDSSSRIVAPPRPRIIVPRQ